MSIPLAYIEALISKRLAMVPSRHFRTVSHHIAAVLSSRNITGYNYMAPTTRPSIHAEMDLVNKLPYHRGRLQSIDILSLRASWGGEHRSARPCWHCLQYLHKQGRQKGYSIKNIFYSTGSGIRVEKLSAMLIATHHHISYGRSQRSLTNSPPSPSLRL